MSNFWQAFSSQDFKQALAALNTSSETEQLEILTTLFQRQHYADTPGFISVLKRTLKDGHDFTNFYQAWQPNPERCQPVKIAGATYRQFFPAPTRVFNVINQANPNEIFSIGLTWLNDDAQQAQLDTMLKKMAAKQDSSNEERHDKIDTVADGQLLGLGKPESDDNLGTPF